MSIILHTGIPGCGKSYYVMHEMMFSGVQDKYFILHNIKGFKKDFFSSELIKDWRDLTEDPKSFFTIKNFEPLVNEAKSKYQRPILLIVDEAWEFFEKQTPEIKEFFSWHRHIGMDIWLITQDATDLDRGIRKRAEYEISGNKSAVIDHFVYIFKVGRSRFRVRKLPKKEEVFRAYESFDVESADKPKSRILQYASAAIVVAVGLLAYGLVYAIPSMFARNGAAGTNTQVVKPSSQVARLDDRKSVPVQVKPKTSGVDWKKYTLCSVMGRKATVQDESGHMIAVDEVAPGTSVLEVNGSCATVMTGAGSIETICKRIGLVKAKAEPAGAGGRGGEQSAPPAPAGNGS
ncbi:MAG: zonular occludens toxin domain-containing protein [Syntrophobacteraceae bacterium]